MSTWHPGAKRVADALDPDMNGVGPFLQPAPPRLVWHTTEGFGLPHYSGSAPHFTLNPRTGELWQHVALNCAAMALLHVPGTVHTNHAHAIQVELIGFAKDTGSWPDSAYANIAKLARWIEANAGVPRRSGVHFAVPATRLSSSAWLAYSGHCGHEHVPGNEHWDPGAFRIEKVLELKARPARVKPKVNPVRALRRARVALRKRNLKRAGRSVKLALDELRRRGK